jgi:hypothetical protein
MATAALACDTLSINRINPYTWSGTYGVNTDGFPNTMTIDGSWTNEIDETPVEYPTMPAYDPNLDLSGAMYLKTASVDPAPFMGFPARKMEFADGRVTWSRPGLAPPDQTVQKAPLSIRAIKKFVEDNTILIFLMIIAIIYYLSSKMK